MPLVMRLEALEQQHARHHSTTKQICRTRQRFII